MDRSGPIVEARDLHVRFPGEARSALSHVSVAIAAGERIAVLGPSGCGKSTLALAVAGAIPALIPAAVGGSVHWYPTVDGSGLAVPLGQAAFVQQDVESQLVALTVESEIAFALENRRQQPGQIDRRIETALSAGPACGLDRKAETLKLSTGWRQRLALAAAQAEDAALTILDEPTAHLDELAARQAIAFLATGTDGALLLVEHRADLVAPYADRILVLDRDGQPLLLAGPGEAMDAIAARPDLGIRMPPTSMAVHHLRSHGLNPRGGLLADPQDLLDAIPAGPKGQAIRDDLLALLAPPVSRRGSSGSPVLWLDSVCLRRDDVTVLADIALAIREGEVVGLAGGNGAGKTSLCLVAAGAIRPTGGRRDARSGLPVRMVPQNPALVFATPTLGLEATRRGVDWKDAERSLARFGLSSPPHRHPLRHSRGELRRIALALSLAGDDPALVVLDEPTAGLDAHGLASLEDRLTACRSSGSGVLVVSHDVDWLARVCDRIVVLASGRVAASGPPDDICALAAEGSVPLAVPPGAALALALASRPGP